MTPEKRKAIAWLQDEIRSLRLAPTINGCGMKSEWAEQYDIMQTCLEAVKVCSVDTNKTSPLTLEQLREMDGQPVWIMEAPDWGHWELSEDAGDYLTDRDPELYGLTYPDPEGKGGLHKLGWIAYAYKPGRIDWEAWSGCECNSKKKACCTCVSMRCQFCIGGSEYKQGKYCSTCGRPLTEKARAELEKRLRR